MASLLSTDWLLARPIEYEIDTMNDNQINEKTDECFNMFLSSDYKPLPKLELTNDEMLEMASRLEREMAKIQKESSEFIKFISDYAEIVSIYTISCRICQGDTSDFFTYESYIYIITRKNIYRGSIDVKTTNNLENVIAKPLNFRRFYTFDKELSSEMRRTFKIYCLNSPSTFSIQGYQGDEAIRQSHLTYHKLFNSLITSITGTLYPNIPPNWKAIYCYDCSEKYLNLITLEITSISPSMENPIKYN